MTAFSPLRRSTITLLGMAVSAALTNTTYAAIQRGKEYQLVKSPQLPESTGKVEILEFFAYTCPHCFKLEEVVGPWSKGLAEEVVFRRIPVVFTESTVPLARTYFALEAMGALEKIHLRVFQALQEQQVWLIQEKILFEWIGKQGMDVRRFEETYRSFGIQTKISRARQLAQVFDINAVPTLVVGGKYQTSASLAGSKEALPKVLDELVALVKKEKRAGGGISASLLPARFEMKGSTRSG